MSDIILRFAGPDDGAVLAATIDAMDRYYNDPERPPAEARAAAEVWLRGGADGSRFVLALAGDEPVNFWYRAEPRIAERPQR